MRVRVPPALYGRLRHYAESTSTTVEAAVASAIEAFLQDRDY